MGSGTASSPGRSQCMGSDWRDEIASQTFQVLPTSSSGPLNLIFLCIVILVLQVLENMISSCSSSKAMTRLSSSSLNQQLKTRLLVHLTFSVCQESGS